MLALPAGQISFVYKYVDDLFIAMHADICQPFLTTMKSALPTIAFTITEESDEREIHYLEFTAKRTGTVIEFCWYRKPFASNRMVDFFSGHRIRQKYSIYKDIYKRARLRTDRNYSQRTKDMFIGILTANHFTLQDI